MRPIFDISFWFTRLVAKASALGGVEMGSTMAELAAMATPISMVGVPPMGSSLSPIAVQTTARMGMSRAAVAELLMKLERP